MTSGSWFSRFRRGGSGKPSVDSVPCEEVRASGSDFIDGDCDEVVHSRIMEHLGLCRDCDSWIKSLAMTVGFLRDAPEVEVPQSTVEKVRKITRGEGD